MSNGLANGYDLSDAPITRLPLERGKGKLFRGEYPWSACAPFVENSRATLIHRPRTGSTYNLHSTGPHVGIGFWCGMHTASDGKNLTFLAVPPEDRILCARCEAAAVSNGLPSADELAGRHVHKGGVVAVATCCAAANDQAQGAGGGLIAGGSPGATGSAAGESEKGS